MQASRIFSLAFNAIPLLENNCIETEFRLAVLGLSQDGVCKYSLKVHKRENFFGSDFEIFTFL